MATHNDVPLEELAESAEEVVANGGVIFFKWTCAGCGARVTATAANTFTRFSKHDNCGHITHTAKTGGNYVAMMASTPEAAAALKDILQAVTGGAEH